ncbi:OprD family outer membrane porin [Pseudomonas guariconensis]|uniref:OprD family outer membrane porin n=1 Tax=Pseudomonas guariconensis TaxID=1288410 RepID=UPI003F68EF9A
MPPASGNANSGTIDTAVRGIEITYNSPHTITLAYQQPGDQLFDYVDLGDTDRSGDSIFLLNSMQYSKFKGSRKKSWQLRNDLSRLVPFSMACCFTWPFWNIKPPIQTHTYQ